MRLALVAVLAAAASASASESWLAAKEDSVALEATVTVLEVADGKNVTRKHNPVCDDSGSWKNSDAAKKEEAVQDYKAATAKFNERTEALEKTRGVLVEARNRLEARANSLRMSIASIQGSFMTSRDEGDGLIKQRNEAAMTARNAEAISRSTAAAARGLNVTIRGLRETISAIDAEQSRVEAAVTSASQRIIDTVRQHGSIAAKAKTENIDLVEAIGSRQGEVEAITARVDALADAVAEVAEEHNATLKRAADLRARRAALSAQRVALSKEVAQLEQDIAKNSAALEREADAKRRAENAASEAQAEEQGASQKATSAEREVSMMSAEKERVEKVLGEDKASMGAAVADVRALAARRDSIQHRLDALANASAELREKESSLVDRHEELRANASVVAEQLSAVRGRLSAAMMDVKRSETAAAAHKSQADAESKLEERANAAVVALRHRATVRHAAFVKSAAQGLLGQCDCSEDADGCSKCGPDGPAGASQDGDLDDAAKASDVLDTDTPTERPHLGEATAGLMAVAHAEAAGADAPYPEGTPDEDADAVTKAAKMVAATTRALEHAKGVVVAAAAAQGANITKEESDEMDPAADLGAATAAAGTAAPAEMSTHEAVALADSTAATASAAKAGAETAIAEAEGGAAANAELEASGIASAPSAAAEHLPEAEDASSADSAEDAAAAPAPDAVDALSDIARFRQRRSLRGGAVLSASEDNSTSSSDGAAVSTTNTSSVKASSPFAGLAWSKACAAYVKATARLNNAITALTAATHAVKIAQVKYERTKAQKLAAAVARNVSRDEVNELSEQLSEKQAALGDARARVARLRADVERIQASIKGAVGGLDDAKARVERLTFTKDDLSEQARSARKALDRANAQHERVQAILEAESAKLEAERAAVQKRQDSLRASLQALDDDLAAKTARLADLQARQREEADGLTQAEELEDEGEAAKENAEHEVDEAMKARDTKATQASSLQGEIENARKAQQRAAEAAAAAHNGVQAAEATLLRMRGEARRLRGALQMARSAVHGTSATHALADADQFSLEIAVQKLQDRLAGRSADVEGLRTRVNNLAKETKAYRHSVDTADEAISQLAAEAAEAERRRQAAKDVEQAQREAAAEAETEKLAKEAELDDLSTARGMTPPGTMQELDEAQAKRLAIESAVGGSRASKAAELVAEAFKPPPGPEDDASAEVKALAAVDPEVDEVLADEAPAAPAPEKEEEDEEEEEPAPEPLKAAAEEDAAAIRQAEKEATVLPEDLPGLTGDPNTDSIVSGEEQPEAEPVDSVEPPPAAGGSEDQEVPPPPMVGDGESGMDGAAGEPEGETEAE